jgi:hypothetical protein
MLRLDSMATASGSGPNPTAPTALSDEQAEQFAASFTPSWDADDGLDGPDAHPDAHASNGAANATLVDAPAVGSAQAAAFVAHAAPSAQPATAAPAPAPAFHAKQTLIGTAPQANAPTATHGAHAMRAAASSAEAIDPENILDSSTAPQPPVRAAAAPVPAPAPQTSLKGTQIMQGAPAQVDARKAQSRPPPAAGPATNARVAVSADPFAAPARSAASARPAKRPHSEDLDDFVPKKSSKSVYFVVAGLAVAAGLGLFLKFALGDDGTKPAPVEQHATGPAVTTAEIPPPPPKVDPPPPPTATTTAAAKVDPPPPVTLPAPPTARQPDPPSAPAHVGAGAQPRPRQPPPPPPQAAAAPPQAVVTPKTAPKPPNGSIVRDNPF